MSNQETMLQMVFVGDIALGNHPKAPGFGFFSRYMEGIPRDLSQRVLPSGFSPDIFFGNLEFVLATDESHQGAKACCLGTTSYVSFLKQAGFTVVNVATNHSWDYGSSIFRETVEHLKKEGIKVVGIVDDFDPANFLKVKDKTIAVLGCSARPRQGFAEQPRYNEFNENHFLDRIREARNHSDLICVSIHWGEEFLSVPSPDERKIARAMVEAGADVVVGHHPHVLREVEHYQGSVIAYSLGNFIGDMDWNPIARESGCLVVEATIYRNISFKFLPAIIAKDYFPTYLNEHEGQKFFHVLLKRYARLNTTLESCEYHFLAKKALRTHQWLTVGFLIKNIFRYELFTLCRILIRGSFGRFK